MAKVSRRATHVPILAKLGTESRFWAFGGVRQKRENCGLLFSAFMLYLSKALLGAFWGKMNFCTLLYDKNSDTALFCMIWIAVSPKTLKKLPWKRQNSPFYFMCHLRMIDNQVFTKRRISSDLIINAPRKIRVFFRFKFSVWRILRTENPWEPQKFSV